MFVEIFSTFNKTYLAAALVNPINGDPKHVRFGVLA